MINQTDFNPHAVRQYFKNRKHIYIKKVERSIYSKKSVPNVPIKNPGYLQKDNLGFLSLVKLFLYDSEKQYGIIFQIIIQMYLRI